MAQIPHSQIKHLKALYEEFHKNPETAYREHRTTNTIAEQLRTRGLQVSVSRDITGVVASFKNGCGPVVGLRADIDALPIEEKSGVAFCSENGAMHACGHDVHITCLLGAIDNMIATRDQWSGTLVVVFQPAEEVGSGARSLINSKIFDEHPRPQIMLGQHVSGILRAGTIGSKPSIIQAAADTWEVTLRANGGHASAPHSTVDLIVLAASIVMRLQTIVSREVPPAQSAVVSVATFHAGTVSNVLPDCVKFTVNARSFDKDVRQLIANSVSRIIKSEAQSAGLPAPPEIVKISEFPMNVNSELFLQLIKVAFEDEFGIESYQTIDRSAGSEDFGEYANAFGIPSVFWFFGTGLAAEVASRNPEPNLHSPWFVPRSDSAIDTGVRALTAAACKSFAALDLP